MDYLIRRLKNGKRYKKAVKKMSNDFYDDEEEFLDLELYNDLGYSLATDSNSDFMDGSSIPASLDFQIFLVLALGFIAGILMIGLRGVFT